MALWQQFETMLNSWRNQGKGHVPILRSDFRMQGKRRVWVGRGQGDIKPDYVDTFLQLANQRYALLPRFIRSLHRNVRFGLIKALALLILREASEGNPEGALRASKLFDRVVAEMRTAIRESLSVKMQGDSGGHKNQE